MLLALLHSREGKAQMLEWAMCGDPGRESAVSSTRAKHLHCGLRRAGDAPRETCRAPSGMTALTVRASGLRSKARLFLVRGPTSVTRLRK